MKQVDLAHRPVATPVFLYVVPDRAAASYLPAAAVQALIGGARLLVALARPRHGFTADAAIARHVALKEREELARLQEITDRLLYRSGVSYEIVPMTYWGTRSSARRQRRIGAAANRLARRRGATPLAAAATPAAAQSWAPKATSSGGPAHVVAVLPDSAEAVRVTRAAGELARESGRPLALVVPVPEAEFSLDPGARARAHARVAADATAVAGRVRPTLDLLGLTAHTVAAPYCPDGTSLSLHRSMAAAIEDVARGLRAEAVVLSAASPALPQLRIPAMLLHRVELLRRVEPVGQDAHQRESDSIPAQTRWTSRQR